MTTTATDHRQHPGGARPRSRARRRPAAPADVYRCEDHYVVLCDLPGLDTGTLDVHVDGRTVTIRGHRSRPDLTDARPVLQQRPTGRLEHVIPLDQPAIPAGVTATYTDGVLVLTVPLAPARPRHRHDSRWPHPVTA
ncbi:Hsp20/alpha crystallin family protein [Couchioplanes azureus]|uniref:Hsp20/alpha crystallin family protein n=1 Tax=Couchioplanes caeruleus TaxID=56438 RepID=UPI001670A6D5|nr:Hsp20/alpha crystallin family protein [Couchioplanes caeruleus]GGQ38173.1 hypothetical protein GCM10010166_00700 [Couchioplanes caeruleus subsp. azureus]